MLGKALGTQSAPITMEVFSDFQCPACRAFYEQTLRRVIDNYVASGKVYLVHRDFPLEQTHKYAREAARYANAAARIGKFEKVEEALYAKQPIWSVDGRLDPVVASVLTPAEMKRVHQLLQNGNLDSAIEQDMQSARKIPVRQTPTVVLTHRGKTYPLPAGGVDYYFLSRLLDDWLRQ
jgi:protein-disulfide isomerase